MADRHLRETRIEGATAFSGKLLEVRVDRVGLPDGQETRREYVAHPGAVMVIAQLDNGKLIFERQFRYPLDRVFLELPAGKIDKGEDILDCARRELQEETGYQARVWAYVGVIHPCIGYSNERIEIFLARGLEHVGHALDDGEFLEVVELSLDQALDAVRAGSITDGKTLAGLLWAEKIFRGGWVLPDIK
ncbi:MAG: NUDIX domain-containing protein [Pseudomonadota bacterium]